MDFVQYRAEYVALSPQPQSDLRNNRAKSSNCTTDLFMITEQGPSMPASPDATVAYTARGEKRKESLGTMWPKVPRLSFFTSGFPTLQPLWCLQNTQLRALVR